MLRLQAKGLNFIIIYLHVCNATERLAGVKTASCLLISLIRNILEVVCVCEIGHVQLLCNPMDCHPQGSSIHGISQARILEWGAISFSREIFMTQGSKLCLLSLMLRCAKSLPSRLTLCDSLDYSPPGSSVHGILQARVLA